MSKSSLSAVPRDLAGRGSQNQPTDLRQSITNQLLLSNVEQASPADQHPGSTIVAAEEFRSRCVAEAAVCAIELVLPGAIPDATQVVFEWKNLPRDKKTDAPEQGRLKADFRPVGANTWKLSITNDATGAKLIERLVAIIITLDPK